MNISVYVCVCVCVCVFVSVEMWENAAGLFVFVLKPCSHLAS